MSVYRIHEGGVHGKFHKDSSQLIKAYLGHLKFFRILEINKFFTKEEEKLVLRKKQNTFLILSKLYWDNSLFYKAIIFRILVKISNLRIKFY